jgi:pyruvate dehydrogenase E2 component (dihydrolipoamide acetyltransferase)
MTERMAAAAASPAASPAAALERRTVPLSGLRGAIARNMGQGWLVPRVAHSVDVDLSRVEGLRAGGASGEWPSLNAFVLHAVARALRVHPRLNALMREKVVELIDDINIGVAVALDDGLMVPVIRNADTLTVAQLAAETRRLADGTRAGTLGGGAYQRGSFTVSNLGGTAVDRFSPIINPPQVAILGIGRTQQRACVKDDAIVAAPLANLTLVFDHRAVDGYPAALFLGEIARRLEQAEFD